MADERPRQASGGARAGDKRRRLRAEGARRTAKVAKDWLAGYQALPPPPEDGVGRVEWANRACALLLHETLTDPGLDPSTRRRQGAELIRTIGMTAVKALYEARLKKLEAKVYGRKETDGSDGIEEIPE